MAVVIVDNRSRSVGLNGAELRNEFEFGLKGNGIELRTDCEGVDNGVEVIGWDDLGNCRSRPGDRGGRIGAPAGVDKAANEDEDVVAGEAI